MAHKSVVVAHKSEVEVEVEVEAGKSVVEVNKSEAAEDKSMAWEEWAA